MLLCSAIPNAQQPISSYFPAKLLFASFANLHKLLSDAEQKITSKKGVIDSHVVSAAFLKRPQSKVKIVFEHLTGATPAERLCVSWDTNEDNWSDEGCEVLKSNASHTVCQCDHLGHFALLAQVDGDPEFVGQNLDFGLIQTKDQAHSNSNTVITLEIATYLVTSVCFLILVILLVQVRNLFVSFPQIPLFLMANT